MSAGRRSFRPSDSPVAQGIANWVRKELWDQVPVRIAVIDRGYRIVAANRAFSRAYGEWRGRSCFSVYKGRSERCVHCDAADTFKDGVTRIHENQGIIKDGEPTYYLVRTVPIVEEDDSIPYIIEMSTDITEVKRLEKQRLDAERLAAVGQTVAGLAHGIKNLLMGLDGGMYIARSGIDKGDVARLIQGWDILEENVDRISSFVREFLDFARGRQPQVESIDPNLPARQVADLFRDTAKLAGIEFEVELDPKIQPAALDSAGIHTCLSNLVSNALDACSTSDAKKAAVRMSSYERGNAIVYEIGDNGIGMDYDVKQKVFTNFFSTKATGKGTGLGLLTTRKIVQEHGGKVSFESEVGQGSVFRLVFERDRLPDLCTEENGAA